MIAVKTTTIFQQLVAQLHRAGPVAVVAENSMPKV
jgi:hypothetical protein